MKQNFSGNVLKPPEKLVWSDVEPRKNSNIDSQTYLLSPENYFYRSLEEEEVENFVNRLCENKSKEYRYKKCAQCNGHFELGKDGKPVRYLMTCASPYCRDKDCWKKRYIVAKKYFEAFFNAYAIWRIKRGSRWVHEVFGFPVTNIITKEYLSK